MSTVSRSVPPGPRGSWLMGSVGPFTQDRLAFLTSLARYGDVAGFRLGPHRCLLINHPDLIEQVLVTDARHYIKHFGARLYRPVLGNGLILSEGDFWLRQRRLAQPAFLKNRLLTYAPHMTDLTERMLQHWVPGLRIDIHKEMANLTSAIALKTLFDLVNEADRTRFTDALREIIDLLSSRLSRLIHLPAWVPTPQNRRLKRALGQLEAVIDDFIAQGRARKEPGQDLLSTLLAARDEDGTRMTDQQLRDEIRTLYLAGHETTALTLTWTWYLLAQHPQIEQILTEEWAAILHGRTPSAEDLPRLTFTEAVITESMRVLPPVYAIGREATCDLELGGYRVRRGTTVFMSQWVTHRDGRWYDQPEEFRPQRWIEGLAKRLPKYAYFPFGGGPRTCIGNQFALMEAVLLLATFGQRYRFTCELPIEFWPAITLLPRDGLWTTLQPR